MVSVIRMWLYQRALHSNGITHDLTYFAQDGGSCVTNTDQMRAFFEEIVQSFMCSPAVVFWHVNFGCLVDDALAHSRTNRQVERPKAAEQCEDPNPSQVSRRDFDIGSRLAGAESRPLRSQLCLVSESVVLPPEQAEVRRSGPANLASASDPACMSTMGTGDSGVSEHHAEPALPEICVPWVLFQQRMRASVSGADAVISAIREFGGLVVVGRPLTGRVVEDLGPPGDFVSLAHFDRFVRCCAEPSAQAAWYVVARSAVRSAAEAVFQDFIGRNLSMPCPLLASEGRSTSNTSTTGRLDMTDLLWSGRLTLWIASAAAAALKPFATAVVASATAGYAHGGCAGAWAGFLPRHDIDEMLRAQAAAEGAPGAFVLRVSGSRPGALVMTYTAPAPASGVQVIHEIMQLVPAGSGVMLRGVEYPSPSHAVIALRNVLKRPCLAASLAVVGWSLPDWVAHGATPGMPPQCSFESLVASMRAFAADSRFAGVLSDDATSASWRSKVAAGSLAAVMGALCGDAWRHIVTDGGHYGAAISDTAGSFPLLVAASVSSSGSAGVDNKLWCQAAEHAARTALPCVSGPASLLGTAWAGPLPAPPPGALMAAGPGLVGTGSSSRRPPQRYAFSGFHASITYEETLARLRSKPPGTYLLRASQGQRSCTVLAFVDGLGRVQQSLVSPDTSPASAGTGKVVCSGNTFPSLLSVILAYSIPQSAGTPALLRFALPPASEKVALRAAPGSHVPA